MHKFLCHAAWILALAFAMALPVNTLANSRIISGSVVPQSDYPEVLRISGSGACTATLVGPRAILTAAHCGANGATVKFKAANGKAYTAKLTQSTAYNPSNPKADLDLAIGLVNEDVGGISPVSVGNQTVPGQDLSILGYGCLGLNIPADGKLRFGVSTLARYYGYAMILERDPPGAAICFGDSGGPTFSEGETGRLLVGVHSRGDIYDTTTDVRLDIPEAQEFLQSWATTNLTGICGITGPCP